MVLVQAKDLRVGDVLIPTNRIVVSVGQTLSTPPSKVTVYTQTRNGRIGVGDWWRSTMIRVQR